MKYFLSLILFLGIVMPRLNAQTEYGETFTSRLYVGGIFGLGLGTFTSIDVSPLIGYNFNRFSFAGVGATYMY